VSVAFKTLLPLSFFSYLFSTSLEPTSFTATCPGCASA
jgi:hypothetical protein